MMPSEPSEQPRTRGWVEAATRVVRIALESPKVKASLNTILGSIDPDASPELVRTLLQTDSAVPLTVLAAAPAAANVAIGAFHELAQQVTSYPPPLVQQTLVSLGQQLQMQKLGEAAALLLATAAEALVPLALAGSAALIQRLQRQLDEDPRLAETIQQFAAGLTDQLARHPDVHAKVIAPLLAPVLRQPLPDGPDDAA